MFKLPYNCTHLTHRKVSSKFSKLGFNSMWTENFKMFKLDLEQTEEPDIKLPSSIGSWKKQENSKKNNYCFNDYAKAFDCVDHNKQWKILKEMKIPDHLTYLLRNLCAGQEATVRSGHGTTDWFQIGKGVHQSCVLSPCLFNLYTEYIMEMLGWMSHEMESRLWEKYQQPQSCWWYPSNGRKWRGSKEPLDEGERGEWKGWVKIEHSKD